jgi:hypothetical protein
VIKVAEHAARAYITSNLRKEEVGDIEITVEANTEEDLSFDVEVSVDTVIDRGQVQQIVDGAVEAAHSAIRTQLDKLAKR